MNDRFAYFIANTAKPSSIEQVLMGRAHNRPSMEDLLHLIIRLKTLFPHDTPLNFKPAIETALYGSPGTYAGLHDHRPFQKIHPDIFRQLFDAFEWFSADYIETLYVVLSLSCNSSCCLTYIPSDIE